jgi:hypothetical protein
VRTRVVLVLERDDEDVPDDIGRPSRVEEIRLESLMGELAEITSIGVTNGSPC